MAQVIIEAEKPCRFDFSNWRTRGTTRVIQSKCKDLRTRGADGVSLSLKVPEPAVPPSKGKRR